MKTDNIYATGLDHLMALPHIEWQPLCGGSILFILWGMLKAKHCLISQLTFVFLRRLAVSKPWLICCETYKKNLSADVWILCNTWLQIKHTAMLGKHKINSGSEYKWRYFRWV